MSDAASSVAVVGPGAVGGLLGALMARAGAAVLFVARPATARRMDGRRLTVESAQFGRFAVEVAAGERVTRPVDLCIVAVKAAGLGAALDLVEPRLVRGPVVPVLNGVDHVGRVAARYGRERTVAAAIRVGAARVSPTVVEHRSRFVDLRVAPLDPALDLAPMVDLLDASGVTVTVDDDPDRVLWDKLVFLAPFALATAAHDESIGPVRDGRRQELVALVGEVTGAGARRGASLGAAEVLAFVDSLPAAMSSSLRSDVVAGGAGELDAIVGPVLDAAAEDGLAVPTVRRYAQAVARRAQSPHPGS